MVLVEVPRYVETASAAIRTATKATITDNGIWPRRTVRRTCPPGGIVIDPAGFTRLSTVNQNPMADFQTIPGRFLIDPELVSRENPAAKGDMS
jgi:hypothetical protein